MQMEVQDLSSTSPNHSSKSKMSRLTRYYDSYTTSGPKRSVELHSYKTQTINPSSTFIAPTRRQSHSRPRRPNKDGRSKFHSVRTEEAQTEVSQNENRRLQPTGVRLMSDGLTWEYLYPDVDSTASRETGKPQKDISDPHVYIGDPRSTQFIYLNSVPVADEEAVDSDDSAEFDAQVEYLDASDISQPPATAISSAVDWNIEQLPQETTVHPPHVNHDYGETYDINPKPRYTATTTTSRRKRRESATTNAPKPSLFQSFFFPGAYREALKQGKVRNDRIEDWVQAVAKELAKEIVQEVALQAQQYPDPGVYERGTAGQGYPHDAEYQTIPPGYRHSRRSRH